MTMIRAILFNNPPGKLHGSLSFTREKTAPGQRMGVNVADATDRRNSAMLLNSVLTVAYFDRMGGTPTLMTSNSRTAGWCGRGASYCRGPLWRLS